MFECIANELVEYVIQYLPILNTKHTCQFVRFHWNPSNQIENIAFDRA